MSSHTPAPWKAHFEEAYYVTGPDLGRVAMMMNLKGAHGLGGRRHGDESAANARLIAAAPELLEALRQVLGWAAQIAGDNSDEEAADEELESIAFARAVIARAIGESP